LQLVRRLFFLRALLPLAVLPRVGWQYLAGRGYPQHIQVSRPIQVGHNTNPIPLLQGQHPGISQAHDFLPVVAWLTPCASFCSWEREGGSPYINGYHSVDKERPPHDPAGTPAGGMLPRGRRTASPPPRPPASARPPSLSCRTARCSPWNW